MAKISYLNAGFLPVGNWYYNIDYINTTKVNLSLIILSRYLQPLIELNVNKTFNDYFNNYLPDNINYTKTQV